MTYFVAPAIMTTSLGLLLAAGLHDAAARTIPNWIPASLAIIGVTLRFQQGNAATGIGVALLLLICLCFLWLRGFIGGGDMKLIPAVALVLPPSTTPDLILSVAIAGGALALVYLTLSRLVRRPYPGPRTGLLARVIKAETWRMHRRGPLPYAIAIAGGALPIFIKTFAR